MRLTTNKDESVSLTCSVQDMQKVICALSYIHGNTFDAIFESTDWDSPLYVENCMDKLVQVVEDVDVLPDGGIRTFFGFEVVE